ncbi:hypothetical protein MPSEU_000155500 [Mayamaea pseudoterrestris]|nr:hypothetical protein MPSEU_000155500 [Mayamaea pseudoterrestris]
MSVKNQDVKEEVLLPPKPIHGGLLQISQKEFIPWTGGTPSRNFEEFNEHDTHKRPNSDGMMRPLSGVYGGYTQSDRIKGLPVKLTFTGDVLMWEHQVSDHLVKFGMDTIAYGHDPRDKDSVVFLPRHCGIFRDVKMVEDAFAEPKETYDQYDKINDVQATIFIRNSIDPTMLKRLIHLTPGNEPGSFAVTYWRILSMVRQHNYDMHRRLEDEAIAILPTDFVGENITAYCIKVLDLITIVQDAGAYDHRKTCRLFKNLLRASGEDSRIKMEFIESFMKFDSLHSEAWGVCCQMSPHDRDQHMAANKCLPQDLFRLAIASYEELVSQQQWKPLFPDCESEASDSLSDSPSRRKKKWCGHCDRQTTHSTDEHRDKRSRKANPTLPPVSY